MLNRWQLALSLTENWIDGSTLNVLNQMPANLKTATAIVDYWITRILGRELSAGSQRSRIIDFMRGQYAANFELSADYITARLPRMVALILMAPDFQYR